MYSKPLDAMRHKHEATVVKRVSRKDGEEAHSGAWKVAFGDFCLALMCLFLVLWVMAARQQERIQELMRAPGSSVMNEGQGRMPETVGGPRGSVIPREPMPNRGNVAVAGRAVIPGEGEPKPVSASEWVPTLRYETASELQALAQVLAQLAADAGLASNVHAVVMPYGLRVMLHDTERQGMFQRGSAVPSERFRRLLRRMGPLFAQMDKQMLVVGHTDSLQYTDLRHAAFSNWTLSSHRAMSARAQLLAGGMAAEGILQVVGMADRAPLDTQDAAGGVNRRIELLILTGAQARHIAAMFGMPRNAQPLTDGVDSALPDSAALHALRARMTVTQEGRPDAN